MSLAVEQLQKDLTYTVYHMYIAGLNSNMIKCHKPNFQYLDLFVQQGCNGKVKYLVF